MLGTPPSNSCGRLGDPSIFIHYLYICFFKNIDRHTSGRCWLQWTLLMYGNAWYFVVLYGSVCYFMVIYGNRSLGCSAPHLLTPAEDLGALQALRSIWALLRAFGPLFSSRRYLTKHTQFRVKIGPNKIFGGKLA